MRKTLTLTVACIAAALVGGFFVFVEFISRVEPQHAGAADGIIVLTGHEDRISAGLDLLEMGRGRRLLISGVHALHRTPEQLLRRLGEASSKAGCCVDLDHAAANTIGNADEAARWAKRWGFRRLIVVTSRHHMPRSLAEFARAIPNAELVSHPVASRYVRLPDWWVDRHSARIVVAEYVKFVAATIRIRAGQMIGAFELRLAGRQPPRTAGL